MTKDADFCDLVEHMGAPPHVIHIRCGNTSNAALRRLLEPTLHREIELIKAGEPIVEIGGD